MDTKEKEAFQINYKGQTINVTGYAEGLNMRFSVHLPEGEVLVYMEEVEDVPTWVQQGKGETELSLALGEAIERHDENNPLI